MEQEKASTMPLPRITVELSEELKKRIRIKAVEENLSLTELVHKLLKQWLEHDEHRS